MQYISSFFSSLFIKAPGPEFRYYIPLAILAGLLIIGSLVFGKLYKTKKKDDFAFKRLFKKVSGRMFIFGILFVFLLLVRYENIPYFSMRIWIYLSLLLLAYAVFHYLRIYLKVYPTEKENVKAKIKTTKKEQVYLPNKKKR